MVAARKLLRRAGRDRAGRFLVEGAPAVGEALGQLSVSGGRDAGWRVHELFLSASAGLRHPELVAAARAAGVPVVPVTDPAAASLSDTMTPQGIVAV